MKRKLRVGVIFGGRSGEHEVSIRSARSVIGAMDQRKYEVVPIAITKDGEWRLQPEPDGLLESGDRALVDETQVIPSAVADFLNAVTTSLQRIADPAGREMVTLDADQKLLPSQPLDVVFPVLHGTYGEDGTIQGLLEMKGVPYVGCGVLASASGMDKVTMKSLFRDAGLPICKYTWFLRSAWETDGAALVRRVAREIGYPCFVKPANLGSSVGVSKATDKESLARAIELAAHYDRKMIVEEGLDAREIECAVMGNDEPEASLPGEYVVHNKAAEFLDYTEKYAGTGHVEFVVPAKINKPLTTRIQKMAARAFQAVDGSGLARVDFFLTRDTHQLLINELNTMPGLTDASGFPKMWEASGLPMPRVIDRLIQLAIERHKEKARNLTSI
ncbi:MAG TPA: D-alanine--D-alanine ligase family protein [Pyrinomonadaceae bacterium]|jgi:D-alanine-D-alanine ligase|nr:D-alanine--D-alanine ligase family protein [Pyrinomonadaceae bacterium]